MYTKYKTNSERKMKLNKIYNKIKSHIPAGSPRPLHSRGSSHHRSPGRRRGRPAARRQSPGAAAAVRAHHAQLAGRGDRGPGTRPVATAAAVYEDAKDPAAAEPGRAAQQAAPSAVRTHRAAAGGRARHQRHGPRVACAAHCHSGAAPCAERGGGPEEHASAFIAAGSGCASSRVCCPAAASAASAAEAIRLAGESTLVTAGDRVVGLPARRRVGRRPVGQRRAARRRPARGRSARAAPADGAVAVGQTVACRH